MSHAALMKRLENLEDSIRTKLEVETGFADEVSRAHKLEMYFKFFDTDNSGQISYEEYFAAMTKLNFVGVQRDLEALFNKFDEDASGTISYKEFCSNLFGLSDAKLSNDTVSVLEKFKAAIKELGILGIHSAKRALNRMDVDGSGTLDMKELKGGLELLGITNFTDHDVKTIMGHFDTDRSGRVSAEELLRGMKTDMAFSRKQIVREAFRRLDADGSGEVTVADIVQKYDTSSHPMVKEGKMTPEEACTDLLNTFDSGMDPDGIVTWSEFLDYYRGMSTFIESDEYFELMIRNAWHISGGTGAAANSSCKHILVLHTDGTQKVYELQDDLGMKMDLDTVKAKLEAQGVTDIGRIKLK